MIGSLSLINTNTKIVISPTSFWSHHVPFSAQMGNWGKYIPADFPSNISRSMGICKLQSFSDARIALLVSCSEVQSSEVQKVMAMPLLSAILI
jgi:hypothetical protein